MKNENQEQDGMTDKQTDVDQSKRKFSKAGLAAPVIMTLASKPVFAVQGLSNMISGNGSGCRGDDFHGGFSHGYWKNPMTGNGSISAWQIATNTTGNNYTAVTVAAAFGTHIFPPATAGTDTLLDVVQSNISPKSQIVAGYLNLFYYLNSGSSTGDYFLTETQFWALNDGDTTTWDITLITDSSGVPIYTDFADLIESNMDLGPGDVCTL